MEQLSSDHPWLIAHDLDPDEDYDSGEQIFFSVHDPQTYYRCRIPELVGRRIRGYFHGWMILYKRNPDNIEWSLWNPVISKLIRFPHLILKDEDEDDFLNCCLSSPPDDPSSILLLMRSTKPNIVFCHCKRKRLRRWTEMSYSKQMKNISGGSNDDDDDDDDDDHHHHHHHQKHLGGSNDDDDDHDDDDDQKHLLFDPICCNGNIYAWSYVSTQPLLIQIQITLVKEKQVVINLLPLVMLPWSDCPHRIEDYFFLKGSGTQLFAISLCVDKEEKPAAVYLYKLDMLSMVWTEIKDLKDTVFFVSILFGNSVYSSPPIALELGGGSYIHILEETGVVIYSYNMKDKTISMSSMHYLDLPPRSICIWPTMPEFRLHGKPKCKDGDHDDQMVLATTTDTARNDDDDDEMKNEACVLNTLPLDVLEMMMKFCVGIEYLNFRATCKLCRLAAPMIQWSNERIRLQTYSLVSPWLMVIDRNQGIMTFTDPMFGDNMTYYSMKASPGVLYYHKILCSSYGWLLLYIADGRVAFFNPFTTDFRQLPPPINALGTASFSAPPTSPGCMVVAFSPTNGILSFHRVGGEGEPSWYRISLEFDGEVPHSFGFPTFCGEDVYTLFNGGGLEVFKEIEDDDNFSWKTVVDPPKTTTSAMYNYQVKCDQHHLLVMVEEFGEAVEVFKLNDCRREWEKIDGLGSHMIYICDTSCLCMDAKIPEMENKIYFPRLHCENEKIVFYSLETCRFHTFNGRNLEQNVLADLFGTKQTVYAHAWIQPTWS